MISSLARTPASSEKHVITKIKNSTGQKKVSVWVFNSSPRSLSQRSHHFFLILSSPRMCTCLCLASAHYRRFRIECVTKYSTVLTIYAVDYVECHSRIILNAATYIILYIFSIPKFKYQLGQIESETDSPTQI